MNCIVLVLLFIDFIFYNFFVIFGSSHPKILLFISFVFSFKIILVSLYVFTFFSVIFDEILYNILFRFYFFFFLSFCLLISISESIFLNVYCFVNYLFISFFPFHLNTFDCLLPITFKKNFYLFF